MKSCIRIASFFILVMFLLKDTVFSRHFDEPPSPYHNSDYDDIPSVEENDYDGGIMKSTEVMIKRSKTLGIAGSRLPDCAHACGACSPCKLVIVTLSNNLACSSPAEAETCPISYKCMCNNKIYPVP